MGDWGLGIGDWGLGIGDWAQSPIPNPQSPIPKPPSPISKKLVFFTNFHQIKYITIIFNLFIKLKNSKKIENILY